MEILQVWPNVGAVYRQYSLTMAVFFNSFAEVNNIPYNHLKCIVKVHNVIFSLGISLKSYSSRLFSSYHLILLNKTHISIGGPGVLWRGGGGGGRWHQWAPSDLLECPTPWSLYLCLKTMPIFAQNVYLCVRYCTYTWDIQQEKYLFNLGLVNHLWSCFVWSVFDPFLFGVAKSHC